MRTAYRCRAYPSPAQQAVLNRTFGCVRVAWNTTLAERRRLWRTHGTGLSSAASDAALTAMKRDPDLAFLAEVSSVPLQQALRHQHQAPLQHDLLGVRAPARRTEPFCPGVEMPVVRRRA